MLGARLPLVARKVPTRDQVDRAHIGFLPIGRQRMITPEVSRRLALFGRLARRGYPGYPSQLACVGPSFFWGFLASRVGVFSFPRPFSGDPVGVTAVMFPIVCFEGLGRRAIISKGGQFRGGHLARI